jgi:hypothetical protein
MLSIWTLDIGRETIGNKTLQRRANVEPISRANVDVEMKWIGTNALFVKVHFVTR